MLAYLRGLFDYLRAREARLGPILERMGLAEDQLRAPEIRVDHALQDEIFALAESLTGDPDVGLHAGETTHLMHFGILGQLAMTCRSVRDLIDLHGRFQRLISTGARISYREQGDQVIGEAIFAENARPTRHTIEYTLASHTTLARLLTGAPMILSRLEVTYARPTVSSEQERLFACPTTYLCERERFFLPAALLDLPLVMGDSESRRVLESEARRRLDAISSSSETEDPELTEVRKLIRDRLHQGAPDVRTAARALGMSVRTLQRRLEQHGLSYRELLDDIRREGVERYLGDTSLSQVDVAALLGYADQSTFHRAFRRWFAMTPGEYRSQHMRPRRGTSTGPDLDG